jgi:peptidyl-prolyl cis-trans isomerase C
MARFPLFPLVVLTALGCQRGGSESVSIDLATKSQGTPVAKFKGGAITVEDVNRQLGNLPPMVRMRLQTAAPKKEYVEGQVRVELLAREAIRQGLQHDPDVVDTVKKSLAQKALQKQLETAAPQPTDEEVKAWYDSHLADYQRPEMVQVQDLFLAAEANDAAKRKARAAEAEKLRSKAAALKTDPEKGFGDLVKASSDDAITKNMGGDLRPLPLGDLQARYGAEVAAAAKGLQSPGDISPVVPTEKGFHVLRLKVRTPARTLPLEDVKLQIKNRLYSERRTAATDELMARLKKESGYTLDEAALAQISAPAPNMPGMQAPHGMGMGPPGPAHPPPPAPAAPGSATGR